MNQRNAIMQYIATVIVALIAWRDMGALAGLAAFVLSNMLWNHLHEQEIAAGNQRFERKWRNRQQL